MKKKVLFTLLVFLCVVALVLPGCSKEVAETSPNEEKVYTMKLAHSYPDTTQHGRNSIYFKELVEKETNGRVIVDIYPNSQLGTIDKEVGMVQSGTVEAALSIEGMVEAIEPLAAIYTLPFLWNTKPGDSEQYDILNQWDSLIETTLREKLIEKGIYRLGVLNTQYGHYILGNNAREIKKPEDMAGLKVRHPGGMFGKLVLDKLSANAVTVAGPEVPVALTQGIVDGLQSATLHSYDAKWITDYLTATNVRCYDIPLIVNLDWWDSLPEDLQDIIQTKVMPKAIEYANTETAKLEKEALEKLQSEYGVKVYLIPDDELEDWANYNNIREDAIKMYVEAAGSEAQKLVDEVIRVGDELKK